MSTDLSGIPGTDARVWDGFLEVVRSHGVRAQYDLGATGVRSRFDATFSTSISRRSAAMSLDPTPYPRYPPPCGSWR
jgi:hypothetical protein